MNRTEAAEILRARAAETAATQAAISRAEALERHVADLRRELASLEERRRRFTFLGDAHAELVDQRYDQRYLQTIEFVVKSRLSGKAMAGMLEPKIVEVKAAIEAAEAQVQEILGQ